MKEDFFFFCERKKNERERERIVNIIYSQLRRLFLLFFFPNGNRSKYTDKEERCLYG